MRKLVITTFSVTFLGIIVLHTLAAVFLCEGAVHLRRKPLTSKMRALAENEANQTNAKRDVVHVESFDGTKLAAWFFRPHHGNGAAVILLHGQGDNRAGMLAYVPMLLRHHYAVLVPDARAQGESDGDLATYGLDESRDLNRWVDWLSAYKDGRCLYALGESMGAAILLQALPQEPRFRAVVAESPFASFREVAYDRLGQKFGGGSRVERVLLRRLIGEAFFYARIRYRIDFDRDVPADAVAATRVPILLIHGTEDFNIPLRHCGAIMRNHSGVIEFWPVRGAGHTEAFGHEPEEFERRVIDWFSRYSCK
jgi:hypothetical protein